VLDLIGADPPALDLDADRSGGSAIQADESG
jgi:hypothetical protein